ncbi:hypothetical protein BDA96_01G123500 [Sorghum bicolor]|uniref:Uncharacterized protein n=1 Tax=Sorghum bicolor TaxID=4558 RepID=A0A921RYH5_SORBI|nr:hypothetical protein BDA96_01G123500 [Sorghum bicolor]
MYISFFSGKRGSHLFLVKNFESCESPYERNRNKYLLPPMNYVWSNVKKGSCFFPIHPSGSKMHSANHSES